MSNDNAINTRKKPFQVGDGKTSIGKHSYKPKWTTVSDLLDEGDLQEQLQKELQKNIAKVLFKSSQDHP